MHTVLAMAAPKIGFSQVKNGSARQTSLDGDVSTVMFSPRPDRAELAHFLSMIDEFDASLDPSTRSELTRWIGRGAFSQAVEILDRLLERTPGNRSLSELRRLLQSSALRLLKGRLGSHQRRVTRSSNADEKCFPPAFARFLDQALGRPRLGELLRGVGHDDLRAHEQIAALARGGFLMLGPPPPRARKRSPPNP